MAVKRMRIAHPPKHTSFAAPDYSPKNSESY